MRYAEPVKPLLLCAGGFALAVLVVVALLARRAPPLASDAHDAASLEIEASRLRERVAALERELAGLRGERDRRLEPAAEAAREPAAAVADPVPVAGDDALELLARYVASFDADPHGSEALRKAVDARVVELVDPISVHLLETWRPQALRVALVGMLGRPRLAAHAGALDALVALLSDARTDLVLAFAALDSLAATRSDRVLPPLEQLAARDPRDDLAGGVLDVLRELAGARWNDVLGSVLRRAPDVARRASLAPRLDDRDDGGALAFLEAASRDEVEVRLAAAAALERFPLEEFKALARRWLVHETDPRVIELLERFLSRTGFPTAHAMLATGAPDANPAIDDDRHAWASAQPDDGRQWIELDYPLPTRATGVRIFEVCRPGAVAEVLVRDGDAWRTVWRGDATPPGAPLEIVWPATRFDVRTIRIVLDTARVPGWNEVDAVELLGLAGPQWAVRGRASSTFGAGLAIGGRTRPRPGAFVVEPGARMPLRLEGANGR